MKDDQPIESLRLSFHERDNSEPADADELLSALEAAKIGTNPNSALALMREMLTRLESGDRSILPYVENWVKFAFKRILDEGVKADQAFGIKAERGQHERKDNFERDIMVVAFFILAIRSGKKRTEAIGDAANKFFPDGKGEKAIEKALSRRSGEVISLRDALEILPSESLQAMLG